MKFNGRGFSIIELIAVIVIIAVLAVAAIVKAPDIGQIRSQQAARKMRSDIRYAQSYALAYQNRTRIDFDASGEAYSVYIEGTAESWSLATNPLTNLDFEVDFTAEDDYSGVTIVSVDFDGADNGLVFDKVGTPYSCDGSGSSISLLSAEGNVTITSGFSILVEPNTGKVKFE